MEQQDKEKVEYLKQLIQEQIKSQDKQNDLIMSFLQSSNKIRRKITLVFIAIALMLAGGIAFIIYTENKPQSILNNAIKTANDLETRISLQRQYINMNTKDIKNLQDSIKKK